jgi:hypothetical protein
VTCYPADSVVPRHFIYRSATNALEAYEGDVVVLPGVELDPHPPAPLLPSLNDFYPPIALRRRRKPPPLRQPPSPMFDGNGIGAGRSKTAARERSERIRHV